MSSGSILPTFGAAPPNIRRAPIPRDLQPDSARASGTTAQQPTPQPLLASVPAGFLTQPSTAPTGSQRPDGPPASSPEHGGSGRPVSVVAQTLISAQANDSNNNLEAARLVTQNVAASRSRISDTATITETNESATGLSDDEQAYVRELKAIDREVRAHEAAHATAGGGLAGRPSYDLVTGPDGIRYAVSGSVEINTEAVGGNPAATIRKLETVMRAALAPAKPSGQDRVVAAQAEAGIRAAQAELNAEKALEPAAETSGAGEDTDRVSIINSQLGQANSEAANIDPAGSPAGGLIAPASLDLLA